MADSILDGLAELAPVAPTIPAEVSAKPVIHDEAYHIRDMIEALRRSRRPDQYPQSMRFIQRILKRADREEIVGAYNVDSGRDARNFRPRTLQDCALIYELCEVSEQDPLWIALQARIRDKAAGRIPPTRLG